MECRLSSSDDDWFCQISIRWEFKRDGRREDQVTEQPFGPVITDKSEVELRLRQAQSTILNPDADRRHFLEMDAGALQAYHANGTSLQFSRNTVCVDLVGPGLTDLSFIDLPGSYISFVLTFLNNMISGIIQNAEDDMIKLVEDLVVSHIKGNCLILVALPMTGTSCSTFRGDIQTNEHPQMISRTKGLYVWLVRKTPMANALSVIYLSCC